MIDLLWQFAQDPRTLTLLALIAADLVLGVAAALRTGTFRAGEIGMFYRTNVLPYVLGYLLIYVLSLTGVARYLGEMAGEISAYAGMGPAVINLGASIAKNLNALAPEPSNK